MSCIECGRSCNPCENCGKCSECCECGDLAAVRVSPRFWRGFGGGLLMALPIWAAILIFAANLVRALEHFSRWAWMVR